MVKFWDWISIRHHAQLFGDTEQEVETDGEKGAFITVSKESWETRTSSTDICVDLGRYSYR